MKISTERLLRQFESMRLAASHGFIIDVRKLEDYRRELIRRGVNVDLERQKIIVRTK